MPGNYIEILDGTKINLGKWCKSIRTIKNGTKRGVIDEDREGQLNQIGFIWDVPKYIFESNVKIIALYYEEYGKYPTKKSKIAKNNMLAHFVSRERNKMRTDDYPEWKMQIIKKYLPNFSLEERGDKTFNQFIYYATLYKNKYGHVNIKRSDMLNEFPIGRKYNGIKEQYRRKTLSQDKINQLEEMGILLINKRQDEFVRKMDLAKQAVAEGITINSKNSFYRGINMQNWIQDSIKRRYMNNELTKEEICVIEKLIGKSLYTIFSRGTIVKIIDVNGSKQGIICNSQCEVIRILQEQYGINICSVSISRRLNGEIATPYKGRFMFYYATDEEVKKYLEDSKAS